MATTPRFITQQTHKKEGSVAISHMTGGLNTYDLPYRIGNEDTPDILNLMWRDGCLKSRDAQAYLTQKKLGTGYSAFTGEYYGYEFYHIGTKIYALDDTLTEVTATFHTSGTISDIGFQRVKSITNGTYNGDAITVTTDPCTVVYIKASLSEVCDICTVTGILPTAVSKGTFFRYRDNLYYKARNVFLSIAYNGISFTVTNVASSAFVPTTYVNCDPRNGAGDAYQPENRLSPKKKITYSPLADRKTVRANDGTHQYATQVEETNYVNMLDITEYPQKIYSVNTSTAGVMSDGNGYSYEAGTSYVYFSPAIETQAIIGAGWFEPSMYVDGDFKRHDFYLPVQNALTTIDSVKAIMSNTSVFTTLTQSTAVLVSDPTVWDSSWDGDFVFWAPTGHLLLKNAPYIFDLASMNNVEVVYSLANTDAYNSIMQCSNAIVAGGNNSMCAILSGCDAQMNAYFWNGNHTAMDISYYPMEQYNLVGDSYETITAFGVQQGMLIIFKESSTWKAEIGTTEVDGRYRITFDCTNINAKKGCNHPDSVQLVENNLVFLNNDDGINILLNTSAADENNIQTISRKVNGTPANHGVIWKANHANRVSSFDDNERYWLFIDGECYIWDYILSTYKDPSFFYCTGINGIAYIKSGTMTHHLNKDGQITACGELSQYDDYKEFACTDYGAAIEKRYATPVFYCGSNDYLKDITRMVIGTENKRDHWSNIRLKYITNLEERYDNTDISLRNFTLAFRNLTGRDLRPNIFKNYIRKPNCKHVLWFQAVFESNIAGYDMSLVTVTTDYIYQGRGR